MLIAASRKEKIEDRVAAAEQAGLKAAVMDVDVFAAQTAFELIESQFPEKGKDQNIAIVDVGATIMAVNVLRNDQSIYMREQPFGATSSRRRSRIASGFPPRRRRRRSARPAGKLRVRSAALHGHDGAGGRARSAVLLYLDSVQPGQHLVLSGTAPRCRISRIRSASAPR